MVGDMMSMRAWGHKAWVGYMAWEHNGSQWGQENVKFMVQ